MNKIYLQKTENNRVQDWFGQVDNNILTFNWGTKGGKLQELINEIKVGKNAGKKNETSPSEQALNELKSTVNKKIQNGYKILSVEGSLKDLEFEADRTVPKPMLAHEYNKHKNKIKDKEIVYIQPKYDGLRCLANLKTGELYSRKGKQFFGLEHIEKDIKTLGKVLDFEWLDGELYNHDLTFQEVMSLTRKKKNLSEVSEIIKLMAYDFISNDKYDARLDALQAAYGESDVPALLLAPAKALQWPCETVIDAAHDKFVDEGFEGLILRRNTPYVLKRTDSLLKFKKFIQEEFPIIGMYAEEHRDTLATFTCVYTNGKTFEVTPAMTDVMKQELWDNRKTFEFGKQYATVKYQELTTTEFDGVDGVPRFGTAHGIIHKDDLDI